MSNNFSNSIRGLALSSVLLAIVAAALVSPGPAAASMCKPGGVGPQGCTAVSVHVFDKLNGYAIDNAKVEFVDPYGNVTYAYDVSMGSGAYVANVTPGTYRIIVTAPAYFSYATNMQVKTRPASTNAPLMPTTLKDAVHARPTAN